MITFRYEVKDQAGLHARPACLLAREAKKYQSSIIIQRGEREATALQLMELMNLSVNCGEEITVRIEGEDEKAAGEGMRRFFEEVM